MEDHVQLEQMSHIHNIYIYIYIYGVLIFKTILKNKFLKIVFEISFLIFYRQKICFGIEIFLSCFLYF